MDETEKQIEISAINQLIANYTPTWEYEGITVVLEKPPELKYLNGYPILEFEPYFYIDGALITVSDPNIYPFQKLGCVKYTDNPAQGFKEIVQRFIDNNELWQR